MKCIIMLVALSCLAIACTPSADELAHSASQVPVMISPEAATEVVPGVIINQAEQYLELQKTWPTGEELDEQAEGFMATGFMKNPSQLGFADLAYTDVATSCIIDDQGRISQIEGLLSGLYDSYSFMIPVVQHRVDAISGSRQVNWEDVIVQLEDGRWRVHPVSLKGGLPFEVCMESSIEFAIGDTIIRIVKSGSAFTCTETFIKADGQEEPLVSWEIDQYELGPVRKIRSAVNRAAGVPVVLSWEPGALAGYIVSLPEGQPEFVQRLRWEPAGNLETDRYNFLVLLTQLHGGQLAIPDMLGTVDPVWLALLMYDHVVNP